jgi:hypothetical protein
MRRSGRPKAARKSIAAGAARAPLAPMATLLDEDERARTFSPEDVDTLIRSAGIAPVPDLDVAAVAVQLRDVITGFILSWRIDVSSPKGEVTRWARRAAQHARAFLRVMGADTNDGDLASNDFSLEYILLVGPPPPRGTIAYQEDQDSFAIRRAMTRQPFYADLDLEVRRHFVEASKHPAAFMLDQHSAIRLGLKGTAYIARLAMAAAERYEPIKRRPRKPPLAVLDFVAQINRIFGTVFDREGSVSPHDRADTRKSPVIAFTQAVAHRTAQRLPVSPTIPRDTGMRRALLALAASRTTVADRIREIRSEEGRLKHPRAFPP